MSIQELDLALIMVLLTNFLCLAMARLRMLVLAVAGQGVLLATIYPLAHQGGQAMGGTGEFSGTVMIGFIRMLLLCVAMAAIKGVIIPRVLFRAIRLADINGQVQSLIGTVPALLIGAVATALVMIYADTLPLRSEHTGSLVVPTALSTVLCGFLLLTTHRQALMQVLGYLLLENGIFIFGLLLVEAMPAMVEIGVLLDLFVGVFVMGIVIHHVSREFPSASSEHLSALRE